MMLVHKPQNVILASPAAYSHRRHPSAPVVVQPTRTPGLLSLSKPVKQSPHRQPPSQQRREPKPVPKVSKHASVVVRAQAPSAEPPKAAHGPSATPSPKAHAKQTSVPKETAQIHRSASHSSLRGKHGRQPSPPIITQIPLHQPPSQAEATSVPPIKSANLFDPFLDSPPPSPSLSRPSGKLARRRQLDSPPASPSPTKAIPVPVPAAQRSTPVNISRSDPVQSNMRPRPVPKRSSTYQDFPICDDLADAATKNYILTPPSTPRRLANGTRSAPLSSASTANGSTSTGFPFNLSIPAPLSTPVRGQRMHRRVPSEGVFTMVDLDIAPGQSGSILNSNVQALFALANKRASLPAASLSTPSFPRAPLALPPRSDDSSPSYDFMTREEQEKAGFFASSMFQNSPSPEDLPDPLLL